MISNFMPVAKTKKETNFSTQSVFSKSKLIQNLGSKVEQYSFKGSLRTVHGRD